MEAWKPAPGYEGIYEVSDLGRVRSLPRRDTKGRRVRGRVRTLTAGPSGHQKVNLHRGGVGHSEKVHRLVALAFLGAPSEGQEVRHLDGDPSNNKVDNLRWGTRSENIRDSVRHGTHVWANKTHCPQGHAYDEGNTYIRSNGARMCRECLRQRNTARRAAQKKEA